MNMPAHTLDIAAHHIHTHAAPGDGRDFVGRRKTWRKNQLPKLVIGRVFVNREAGGDGFGEDAFAIQPGAVVFHFNNDLAHAVLGPQLSYTYLSYDRHFLD